MSQFYGKYVSVSCPTFLSYLNFSNPENPTEKLIEYYIEYHRQSHFRFVRWLGRCWSYTHNVKSLQTGAIFTSTLHILLPRSAKISWNASFAEEEQKKRNSIQNRTAIFDKPYQNLAGFQLDKRAEISRWDVWNLLNWPEFSFKKALGMVNLIDWTQNQI